MSADDLIKFGLYVEAMTFPELRMTEAVDAIIAAGDKINLSAVVPPTMSPDPLGTVKELQKVLATLRHDNQQKVLYVVAPVTTFLVLVTTVFRLWGRKQVNGALKKADWCAAFSAFFSVALCFIYLFGQFPAPSRNGAIGHHIWDISFSKFQFWLLGVTINEISFSVGMTIVRLAWLVFYYELSPNTHYRRLMAITGTFIIILSIISIPLVIFQCKPIDTWNGYNIFTAKCIDKKKAFTAVGALTIVTDILLLVLPIALVMRLRKLRLWEKIQIVVLFGAGGFVCIMTIMRILTLNDIVTKVDTTYDGSPTLCWGAAELNSAIIVSNLPAMRSLFSHWYHACNRNAGRAPSSFVIKTDGERAWKVEDGVPRQNINPSDDSLDIQEVPSSSSDCAERKGKNTRGSRFFAKARKGVTDSSLFKGSLFRDTVKSHGRVTVDVAEQSSSGTEREDVITEASKSSEDVKISEKM